MSRNQPHSPGLHRQRLPASPLPREIDPCDEEEVGLVERADVHRGDTLFDKRVKQSSAPEHCRQEQRLINERQRAPKNGREREWPALRTSYSIGSSRPNPHLVAYRQSLVRVPVPQTGCETARIPASAVSLRHASEAVAF